MKDKITFVIPSRNNLEFLQLAYKSIRNLETKHEILVLNDASTDGTKEWIDSLGDNDLIVTQVAYDTGVAHGDSVPDNFPTEYSYLVAIYASIKSLENALAAKNIPTVAGDGTELTGVSQLSDDNEIDVLADQDEIDQWFSTAGHLIEGEEDIELASAQLQKIGAYINAYQAQLQGNTTDYQWMQGRHQILSQQYERAFAAMAPPQPQQQAGGRR